MIHTGTPASLPPPPFRSLALAIRDRVQRSGDRVALRVKWKRTWEETTWRQLGAQVDAVAAALLEAGVDEGEMVGILSANRPEWTVADVGALTARTVPVPVYPTSSPKQAAYILDHAGVRVLFVDTRERWEGLRHVLDGVPSLRQVVVFDGDGLPGEGAVVSWEAFLARGRGSARRDEVEARLARATPDDLLTLIYTSGTTGEPKGVMLTHANLFATMAAHDLHIMAQTEADVSLCFLPLSHVFERMWTYNVLCHGMVNVYVPDPKDVVRVMGEVKPTVMCAVPRFYEKVYATIHKRMEHAPPLRKALFHWSVGVGKAFHQRRRDERWVSPWLRAQHALADRLVLHKVREAVGGRIRFFPCAGAPLSSEIDEFFHAAGVFLYYAYGLTETTATVTCRTTRHFNFGKVGVPMPGLELRLADDGEILVRGPTVMVGYFKKPAETAAVLRDGWLHTGDAGRWDERGHLQITERIKDLFKSSGGKYIAPQAIESSLGADALIDQVVVIGDQRKFVTALVVPSFDALEEHARARGIAYATRDELVQHPVVQELYKQRIAQRTADFSAFERVKKFTLLPEPFTIDQGEVTPSLKIRRRVVEQRYQHHIERMYNAAGQELEN